MKECKLRHRIVNGSYEWQVVVDRKIVWRADFEAQARQWAESNGYIIVEATK